VERVGQLALIFRATMEDLGTFDPEEMQGGHQIETAKEGHSISLSKVADQRACFSVVDVEGEFAVFTERRFGLPSASINDGSEVGFQRRDVGMLVATTLRLSSADVGSKLTVERDLLQRVGVAALVVRTAVTEVVQAGGGVGASRRGALTTLTPRVSGGEAVHGG
jgi:hypothetical protein